MFPCSPLDVVTAVLCSVCSDGLCGRARAALGHEGFMVTARLGAKRQRHPWKRSFLLEHSVTAFSSEVKVVVTVIAVISASMQ